MKSSGFHFALAITFKPGFAGNKVIYSGATSTYGYSSGWQAVGTWKVPGAAASGPSVAGVVPNAGAPQPYTFTFTDDKGWQDIGVVNILINNAIDGRGACYLAFVPSGAQGGSLFLVDDAGNAGGPFAGMVLPGSGSVANHQCSVAGTGSLVSGSGNTLTLTLPISFDPAFSGQHAVYLAARNSTQNSGWQSVGVVFVTPP